MILVVGSTGAVGSLVAKSLAKAGKKVTALVRDVASNKSQELKAAGANLVVGDLKDAASIRKALEGVDTVICTATCTASRRDGDGIETVDQQGTWGLIDAAIAAKTKKFIFVSYSRNILNDFPLSVGKRTSEKRLEASSMDYTILLPSFFPETWLSPAVGFDVANGKATIYGDGKAKTNYIGLHDVAAAVVGCVDNPAVSRKAIPIGGSEAFSQLDAVKLAEEASGKKLTVGHMTADQIKGARGGSNDSITASFLGLFDSLSRGDEISTDWMALTKTKAGSLRDWVKANVKRA